jgi:hypothetical protein
MGVACVVGIPLFLLLYVGVPAAAALYWSLQLWPDLLAWLLIPTAYPFSYLIICSAGILAFLPLAFFLSQWLIVTSVGRLFGGHALAPSPPEASEAAPPHWRRTHQRRVIVTDPGTPGRRVILEETVVDEHLTPHGCPRCAR